MIVHYLRVFIDAVLLCLAAMVESPLLALGLVAAVVGIVAWANR
jgi:hypothetical protein